jgi:hypothetical protein
MADPTPSQMEVLEFPEAEPEEVKGELSKFLSQPFVSYVTLVGTIASVVAIPLAIYFFVKSKETPELAYYIYPVKGAVVQTGQASRLVASFDGQPIQSDISVAQVAIWNQGNRPLKSNDVLRPIVISTEGNAPILEATIRKNSREVTQLSLNTDEIQKGRLRLNWAILEQSDGGIIQLIYVGGPKIPINVDGIIEGQPQLTRVQFTGTIKSPYEQYESERGNNFPAFFSFVVCIVLVLGIVLFVKNKREYAVFYRELVKSQKRYFEDLDRSILMQNEFIKTREETHKQMSEVASDYPGVTEMVNSWLAYKESSKASIENLKAQKLKIIGERGNASREEKRQLRNFNVIITVLVLLSIAALATSIYFRFLTRPEGPPFGF